jgi:hypothetical protein
LEKGIETYLGFCLKAGKLTCGANAIECQRDKIHLMILCSTASHNAEDTAIKLSQKFGCKLITCQNKPLAEIVGKLNCKIAAVKDESLAEAIINKVESGDTNFKYYNGGNR